MGNLRLVPSRHARNTARIRRTRVVHQTKHKSSEAGVAAILQTQAQSDRGRSQSTTRRPVHQRDKEGHLDSQPSVGPQEDTDVLRMCVDYGPVNKHCQKDHFPLPRIDQIIDSTAGCDLLSFLDAYSGYNQIRMKEEDEDHTSFITPYGVFCYRTMPFGLKNTCATYQRMMQACLRDQIGRNVQVYVDNIIIKTYSASTLLDDLRETFTPLNKYRIKLNPKKCVFGVPTGKLLGYMVSARGIKANPEKVQAISKMQEPTNIKGVQQLTGRLAVLRCFI